MTNHDALFYFFTVLLLQNYEFLVTLRCGRTKPGLGMWAGADILKAFIRADS